MIAVRLKPAALAAYKQRAADAGNPLPEDFTGPEFYDHYAKSDAAAGIIVYSNGGIVSETFHWADVEYFEGKSDE